LALPLGAQGLRDDLGGSASPSQVGESALPLKRVVILTSGLAYYEHSGSLSGDASINLPFRLEAVNDALKTLIVNDPSSASPSVTYQAENTLLQTLRSLSVDLSDNPDIVQILSRLRGASIEITHSAFQQTDSGDYQTSQALTSGKIAGVYIDREINHSATLLVLNTDEGIKTFDLSIIANIKFKDAAVEQDIKRALELIASSRNSFSRRLLLKLPATGTRNVTISYVIPSPVWKVSYRLDLGAQRPLFQGWAIIDNDSDTDWNNVQLSLVTGRPTSFVQNLYPPYYVYRPTLPLSIAGTAQAQTHDRAADTTTAGGAVMLSRSPAPAAADGAAASRSREMSVENAYHQSVMETELDTASGSAAGGQFEFTIKTPVNLNRGMSAMFPLVQSAIEAKKLLFYSSGKHPRLGAEITNTSAMKLPAGPVTVYDGGVYAGDALIEFWNENEKRIITFGEDLSVSASSNHPTSVKISAVTISGGIMSINRTYNFVVEYSFINSDSFEKQLVLEKPKTSSTTLVSPQAAEQTNTAYRFNVTLEANKQTKVAINEERTQTERITLLSQRPDAILSYSTNAEIPQNVRQALSQAVSLKRSADSAASAVKDIEAQKTRLIGDQDRIRRNLEAAGAGTPQGQEYLKRLVALDGEIDALSPTLEKASLDAKTAQQAYENYLNTLNL
jgi:hypothetical protein